MRKIFIAVLICAVGFVFAPTQTSFGQMGPNSTLHPSVVPSPYLPPPHAGGFGNRLAADVAGRPYAPRVNHGGHAPTVIVPYPLYYGGYYYDPSAVAQYQDANAGAAPPPDYGVSSAPSVVINQTFVQDHANPVVRDYPNLPPPDSSNGGMRSYDGLRTQPYPDPQQQAARNAGDQPTLYLIAFKDHSIVSALGYWVEGSSLHYVSVEHTLNQASLDLIDRDLSQRLNDERNVEFHLPR